MTCSAASTEDPPAPRALALLLDLVECCIEEPVAAARHVAMAIALAAIVISAAATLFGTNAGLAFALLYTSSGAMLVYCLQKSRECVPDAR
jgi:hypothetical protein